MAAWFIAQPERAKKMYMMIVMAMAPRYMTRVDPTSKTFQTRESPASTFSRQNSAHV